MSASPEPRTITPALFREALSPAEAAFEERRKSAGLVMAPALFLLVWFLPFSGLSTEAHRLAAILSGVIALWMTEAIPLPVTGMLGVALAVICGVDSARETLEPFSNHLVFLMIGGFILAEAIFVHGLNRRFAFAVLSLPWVGARPGRILVAYAVVTAFLSMWVSNTASTALMMPIGMSLLSFLYLKRTDASGREMPVPNRDFATALMLTTAFAASLGGLMTPVGTPTNLIGMGFIREQLDIRINFFQWVFLAAPIVGILLAWTVFTLHRGAPAGIREIPGGRHYIIAERRHLGPLSYGERNVLVIFAITIFLWILPGALGLIYGTGAGTITQAVGERLPEGIVALLGASVLFILPLSTTDRRPTLAWSDAVKIDWGTVLLLGTGMALGRLTDRSGLAASIGEGLATALPNGSMLALLVAATFAAVLISETTSNMASVTMLVPLVIPIARGAGVDPLLPALGATIGGSLGFMLPVSTPPNALVYGSGYVPIAKMVRYGVFLDLMGVVAVVAVLYFLGPVVLG